MHHVNGYAAKAADIIFIAPWLAVAPLSTLTHSLTHSITYSLTHSLTHSVTHSLAHSETATLA